MKKLNVGDVIYRYHYGSIKEQCKIDRVTAKRAFSGGNQFKIEYEDGGFIHEIGGSISVAFYASNERRDAEWERKQVADYVCSKNLRYFDTETLKKVKHALEQGVKYSG